MSGWWRRRTLHTRLSLLVTGAVTVAVLALAGLAWTAVSQVQQHRVRSDLNADARAIAARPDQWRGNSRRPGRPGVMPPGAPRPGPVPDDLHRPHDLGPRWQILATDATVLGASTVPLPVTAGARQVAAGAHRAVQEQVTVGDDTYLMVTVPVAGGGAVQVAIDQGREDRTLAVFGLLLAAGSIAVIAGAAVLGRAVARAGLLPVQRLTEAVEEVAVSMDLTRPIAANGADEIARLGRSVNTMLAAIDTARQAQRTLVEDAGHELRTPLTSIRTNIELLLAVERQPELAHRLPPEERAKLLSDLDAQVRELATLTTELVELSREEATREATEPVEFGEVVAAAVGRARTRAPGLAFASDLVPVVVQGRAGELERMVLNVLDNAAKWSPPGAGVRIELRADGPDRCELTVTDSGPGIDDEDLPHVFDRFYRAAAARAMPGSGLGLAIVAQTAGQHGGTVVVGAHEPHGTTVTIRLPRLPDAAA
ncbi:HAMP domain-containing sensor histidine kinase [Actinoplanes sp. NPDC026623]|uniref:HAMP domain-containing sensor histidine kinase n=1 Tax=Actinoplanes sp. NPDC026623 TaxID=3155610 RepID=UPI0033F0B0BE